MKFLPLLPLLLLAMPLEVTRSAAAEPADLPKPVSRTVTNLHGWSVRVDDRLFAAPNEALGRRALQMLDARLNDIPYVVAEDRLKHLRSVTIVLDLTHGRLRTMQYHPSASWLEQHGYSRDLAKCVHIPEAADFARARQVNEQPWVVLHELAHAYHDQVVGFDEPRIQAPYEKFKRSGHGERVLLYDGTYTRHYALTDAKEFFAEFTETYFGINDFFPFNRAELKTSEPEIYSLMLNLWGPIRASQPGSP